VSIRNSSAVSSIYADSVSLGAVKLSIYGNSGTAATGGGISCINCPSLNIDQSSFINLNGTLGGAIYVE
jgi:hypothetical protein